MNTHTVVFPASPSVITMTSTAPVPANDFTPLEVSPLSMDFSGNKTCAL
jgi:hypothetical protein